MSEEDVDDPNVGLVRSPRRARVVSRREAATHAFIEKEREDVTPDWEVAYWQSEAANDSYIDGIDELTALACRLIEAGDALAAWILEQYGPGECPYLEVWVNAKGNQP